MKSGSRIESIGIKLPEKKVSSSSITNLMKLIPSIKLELISGIKERRHCSDNEDTITLALEAAYDCLSYSSYKPEDLEMIIFCGISKLRNDLTYYYEPSISCILKKKLKATGALNFDIVNACAGMVTGINIANNYIQTGIVTNCMIISGEYISSISDNAVKNIITPLSSELASLTIGDAGAAVILEHTSEKDGFEIINMKTHGQHSKLCIAKLSNKFPGSQMFTQMQKLFKVSMSCAPDFLEKSLTESGLNYNDIDILIPHQTSKRAIIQGANFIRKHFNSEPREVIINIDLMGNTASTTHLLALYKLLKENRVRSNDRIMLLSFASGLIIGTAVFKLGETVEKYK